MQVQDTGYVHLSSARHNHIADVQCNMNIMGFLQWLVGFDNSSTRSCIRTVSRPAITKAPTVPNRVEVGGRHSHPHHVRSRTAAVPVLFWKWEVKFPRGARSDGAFFAGSDPAILAQLTRPL